MGTKLECEVIDEGEAKDRKSHLEVQTDTRDWTFP